MPVYAQCHTDAATLLPLCQKAASLFCTTENDKVTVRARFLLWWSWTRCLKHSHWLQSISTSLSLCSCAHTTDHTTACLMLTSRRVEISGDLELAAGDIQWQSERPFVQGPIPKTGVPGLIWNVTPISHQPDVRLLHMIYQKQESRYLITITCNSVIKHTVGLYMMCNLFHF